MNEYCYEWIIPILWSSELDTYKISSIFENMYLDYILNFIIKPIVSSVNPFLVGEIQNPQNSVHLFGTFF